MLLQFKLSYCALECVIRELTIRAMPLQGDGVKDDLKFGIRLFGSNIETNRGVEFMILTVQ